MSDRRSKNYFKNGIEKPDVVDVTPSVAQVPNTPNVQNGGTNGNLKTLLSTYLVSEEVKVSKGLVKRLIKHFEKGSAQNPEVLPAAHPINDAKTCTIAAITQVGDMRSEETAATSACDAANQCNTSIKRLVFLYIIKAVLYSKNVDEN